jgi:hypothetical protein
MYSFNQARKPYEEGLIHPGYIGYGEFIEVLKTGKEERLEKLRVQIEREQIDDIHSSMEWWACFERPKGALTQRTSVKILKNKQKDDNKTKKSKKKQSKLSKKANRKKK